MPTRSRTFDPRRKAKQAYTDARRRCTDPRHADWSDYGGRGLALAPLRASSFAAFLEEVGMPPDQDACLDRTDNARGYVPGNVRWVSPEESRRNRRGVRFFEHDGRRLCLAEWAREADVPYPRLL